MTCVCRIGYECYSCETRRNYNALPRETKLKLQAVNRIMDKNTGRDYEDIPGEYLNELKTLLNQLDEKGVCYSDFSEER